MTTGKKRKKMKTTIINRMVICAWCKKVLHYGDTSEAEATHGMCPSCAEKMNAELDVLEKKVKEKQK